MAVEVVVVESLRCQSIFYSVPCLWAFSPEWTLSQFNSQQVWVSEQVASQCPKLDPTLQYQRKSQHGQGGCEDIGQGQRFQFPGRSSEPPIRRAIAVQTT
jgi:hypothetical protein